jgi:electron transport complex protein RnfD
LFGVGIGVLVVIIRIWGGLPEGVMYAILLMNALVPFINRATQPRKFGSPSRGPRVGKGDGA